MYSLRVGQHNSINVFFFPFTDCFYSPKRTPQDLSEMNEMSANSVYTTFVDLYHYITFCGNSPGASDVSRKRPCIRVRSSSCCADALRDFDSRPYHCASARLQPIKGRSKSNTGTTARILVMKSPLQVFNMAARSRTPFVLVEPKRSRQLPPELVALILSYAASTGNPSVGDDYTNDARPPMSIRCGKQSQPILCTSSLVSKLWNHIAVELLYDSVYLSSPRSLSLLSATLCRRKELRTLVHRFVYAPPKDVGAGAGAGTMPFSSWRDLHRIHSMCPHLEARTIKQSDTRTKRYGRLLLRKAVPALYPPAEHRQR